MRPGIGRRNESQGPFRTSYTHASSAGSGVHRRPASRRWPSIAASTGDKQSI